MKLLLIGCGYWGTKLAERFKQAGLDLALLDKDADRQIALANKLKIGGWCNMTLESALTRSDAMAIATPPDTHYEITKQCLEAGKHVLVEKPMALKAKEARELVYLAQDKKLTLMTDDTFLYSLWKGPGKQGSLVRSMEMHWTGPRPQSQGTPEEGILWTLGPHPVSLMLKHMGRYPFHVEGYLTPRQAVLVYSFVGQDEAAIFLDWDTPGRERYMYWSVGANSTYVDFDDVVAKTKEDPLTKMCEAFVQRVEAPKPWIDYHGLKVVEILEYTEKNLCKSR